MSTKRRPSGLTAVVAVASVVAVGGIGWRLTRGERRAAAPVAATAPAAVPAAARAPVVPPEPDPTFPTREQRVRYFTAKVEGERRALRVVDTAIRKMRAEGGDAGQIAKLESLRATYQQRLERHQAQLSL
jgi:hypothetical protein